MDRLCCLPVVSSACQLLTTAVCTRSPARFEFRIACLSCQYSFLFPAVLAWDLLFASFLCLSFGVSPLLRQLYVLLAFSPPLSPLPTFYLILSTFYFVSPIFVNPGRLAMAQGIMSLPLTWRAMLPAATEKGLPPPCVPSVPPASVDAVSTVCRQLVTRRWMILLASLYVINVIALYYSSVILDIYLFIFFPIYPSYIILTIPPTI